MKKRIALLSLAAIAITSGVSAQKGMGGKFGAEMGVKSVMGKPVRVPYTDVITYFGYVKPGSKPDEERGGKKYYYLYLWIPAAAPEIGVRMVSPIPEGMKPEKEDFVSSSYEANAGEKTNFFDTWISLERAEGIASAEGIEKAKTASWNTYEQNDDSGEMPAQPSGSNYNSLMRITSEVSNPKKALVAGVYRICFTTYKVGEVKGGFVAQVGAPVKLPGVKIAASVDELIKAVAESK